MATVTFKKNPVQLAGNLPAIGEKAPDFIGVKGDLSEISLSEFKGKRVVLNIFPSLDTAVCAASVRRFNKEASALGNTTVLCLSKDLPFAQTRFCTVEGLENVIPLSLFRSDSFAEKYGLEMTDGPLNGLFARSVIVLDEDGVIIYEQLVPEITDEPDYDAAIGALK